MKGREGSELKADERISTSGQIDSAASRTSLPTGSNALSLIDLGNDDNNTIAIPSRELSALLAETQDQSKRVTARPAPMAPASSSEIRQREVPVLPVPSFPEEPSLEESAVIESNLHQIDQGRIVDSLASIDGHGEDLDVPIDLAAEIETAGPLPQARRSAIARFFIGALAIAAVLQIAATVSEISGVTWLDPRPILIAGLMFVRDAVSSVFSKPPSP